MLRPILTVETQVESFPTGFDDLIEVGKLPVVSIQMGAIIFLERVKDPPDRECIIEFVLQKSYQNKGKEAGGKVCFDVFV